MGLLLEERLSYKNLMGHFRGRARVSTYCKPTIGRSDVHLSRAHAYASKFRQSYKFKITLYCRRKQHLDVKIMKISSGKWFKKKMTAISAVLLATSLVSFLCFYPAGEPSPTEFYS